MGEHNRGGRQHPRVDDAKERRILAILDGKEIAEGGFVAQRTRVGERKFYIGNVAYSATESELREFFASVGTITELHLFVDFNTRRSRGFAVLRICGNAFELDGALFQGRELKVDSWDRE
jgi:RNA recognition motif. (a.k.a. RRM, RBD, or RNP domain)